MAISPSSLETQQPVTFAPNKAHISPVSPLQSSSAPTKSVYKTTRRLLTSLVSFSKVNKRNGSDATLISISTGDVFVLYNPFQVATNSSALPSERFVTAANVCRVDAEPTASAGALAPPAFLKDKDIELRVHFEEFNRINHSLPHIQPNLESAKERHYETEREIEDRRVKAARHLKIRRAQLICLLQSDIGKKSKKLRPYQTENLIATSMNILSESLGRTERSKLHRERLNIYLEHNLKQSAPNPQYSAEQHLQSSAPPRIVLIDRQSGVQTAQLLDVHRFNTELRGKLYTKRWGSRRTRGRKWCRPPAMHILAVLNTIFMSRDVFLPRMIISASAYWPSHPYVNNVKSIKTAQALLKLKLHQVGHRERQRRGIRLPSEMIKAADYTKAEEFANVFSS